MQSPTGTSSASAGSGAQSTTQYGNTAHLNLCTETDHGVGSPPSVMKDSNQESIVAIQETLNVLALKLEAAAEAAFILMQELQDLQDYLMILNEKAQQLSSKGLDNGNY